ncbi:hypothetical protein [Actinomadura opuntiae]|uniref:hypothetical protein n=1 Tax=Actinomadura sp. OS1-43 TaxID=604315 RepID=UPI00255A94C2|nr:hypothetical protein [Actinomadura sp. OS1-43]MDL4821151.1 hypothetical protein [Actinomadura sp. OS1-43]
MTGESLGRHLVRGAVGFGALAGAVALVPVVGLAADCRRAPLPWGGMEDHLPGRPDPERTP